MTSFRSVPLEQVPLISLPELVEPHVYGISKLYPVPSDRSDLVVTCDIRQCILERSPALRRDRDYELTSRLSKQRDVRPSSALTGGHALELAFHVLDAKPASERHLCDRDDLSAAGDVVYRIHEARSDQLTHQVGGLLPGLDVRLRRSSGDTAVNYLKVVRAL